MAKSKQDGSIEKIAQGNNNKNEASSRVFGAIVAGFRVEVDGNE